MSKGPAEEHYVVGVTGASGAVYARAFAEALLAAPERHAHVIFTPAALRVFADELGPPPGDDPTTYLRLDDAQRARMHAYSPRDIGARPASGTFLHRGMIIVPCSMNTLACVAGGLQPNLLTRAAAVTLKEGRPLILVPRETPLSLVELRNMTAAAEAGAAILPASPGFYHQPASIEDLVQFIVQKIMDRLGLTPPKPFRWEGRPPK